MLLGLGHWQAGVGFHVTFTGAVVAASLAVIRWLAVGFQGPDPPRRAVLPCSISPLSMPDESAAAAVVFSVSYHHFSSRTLS